MKKNDKRYKVVNLMYWDDYEEDENVESTSLSDEYTTLICNDDGYDDEYNVYPDQNQYIGKYRYFYMTLKSIKKQVWKKENINLFCINNPECYGEEFFIYNDKYEYGISEIIIKYKPLRK